MRRSLVVIDQDKSKDRSKYIRCSNLLRIG
jgi:hypothetical protein